MLLLLLPMSIGKNAWDRNALVYNGRNETRMILPKIALLRIHSTKLAQLQCLIDTFFPIRNAKKGLSFVLYVFVGKLCLYDSITNLKNSGITHLDYVENCVLLEYVLSSSSRLLKTFVLETQICNL